MLSKPLLILPQTIGPFKRNFSKGIAKFILKRAEIIYSRDHINLPSIKKLVNENKNNIKFGYDLGFVLEPSIANERIPSWINEIVNKDKLVGLNVSGLLYIGGYNESNMFGLKDNYQKLIHEIISYFTSKHECKIMLVPHVSGDISNKESDMAACNQIYNQTSLRLQSYIYSLEEEYDHHELKSLIGRCNFFIGSRMHACIAALSQGVPAIGLSYSQKFIGVFEAIGTPELVIDLRQERVDSVIGHIEELYDQRVYYNSLLISKMTSVREQIFTLFK
jgi:polysaccharide pyruvyl transferase WcaK-like protein